MANSNRGFAAMDEAKRREIASKGGKASGISRSASSKRSDSTSSSSNRTK